MTQEETQDTVDTLKKISDRKKKPGIEGKIGDTTSALQSLPTQQAPDVAQIAQVPLPDNAAAVKAATPPAPEPPQITQARNALMAGGNAAQPPQVAAPPATSPDEDALTNRLKQLMAPPQPPTTVPGQLGQLLGGFARTGWMNPAQAQQLEMQRQGFQAGQQQQNIQNTLAQLKDIQEQRYRQQELQRQNYLAQLQGENIASETAARRFQPIGRGGVLDRDTMQPIPGTMPTPQGGADIQKYNVWKSQQLPGADTSIVAFEKAMAGVKPPPEPTGDVQKYNIWKSQQKPGSDTSIQAYEKAMASTKQQPDHGTTGFAGGKVVRLEPGQDVPEGFTTAQQAGSANAADAKATKSAQQTLKFGQDYLSGGRFTGSGDEALMEGYFDLVKPSSGFRMTQQQMDMLLDRKSVV